MTVLATYISINQIACPAPTEASYLVYVSNDGVTPSGHLLHIAHDPNCYNCVLGDGIIEPRCNRTVSPSINSLRPRQNGRRFADDTFKRIFLNENVGISIIISLKFVPKGPINNIQNWFR